MRRYGHSLRKSRLIGGLFSGDEYEHGEEDDEKIANDDGYLPCPRCQPLARERSRCSERRLPRQGREECSNNEEQRTPQRHPGCHPKSYNYGSKVHDGGGVNNR
jgi:hypothetical protein